MLITLSLVFLALPLVLIYLLGSKKTLKRLFILLLTFILCALPMIYGLIDDKFTDYQDANIGLGILFFTTWCLTAIPYFILIGLLITKYFNSKKN